MCLRRVLATRELAPSVVDQAPSITRGAGGSAGRGQGDLSERPRQIRAPRWYGAKFCCSFVQKNYAPYRPETYIWRGLSEKSVWPLPRETARAHEASPGRGCGRKSVHKPSSTIMRESATMKNAPGRPPWYGACRLSADVRRRSASPAAADKHGRPEERRGTSKLPARSCPHEIARAKWPQSCRPE